LPDVIGAKLSRKITVVGWDRGADRTSYDADVSTIPYSQNTKLKFRFVEHLSEDLLASNVLSIVRR